MLLPIDDAEVELISESRDLTGLQPNHKQMPYPTQDAFATPALALSRVCPRPAKIKVAMRIGGGDDNGL